MSACANRGRQISAGGQCLIGNCFCNDGFKSRLVHGARAGKDVGNLTRIHINSVTP
jgi:hypothetical protein